MNAICQCTFALFSLNNCAEDKEKIRSKTVALQVFFNAVAGKICRKDVRKIPNRLL